MTARMSGRLAVLLAAVGVLIVLVGGWVVLVSPQRSNAEAVQTQIDDTQAKLASTKAYLANAANKQNVRELRLLQALLPQDARMSQVLRQLSAAAAQSGVKITSVAPTAAVPSGSGQAIPITLVLAGHYFNVGKFVHLLDARARVKGDSVVGDGRLYSVGNLQINAGGPASGSSGQAPLTVTVDLGVYSYGTSTASSATTTSTTSSGSSASTDTSTTSP